MFPASTIKHTSRRHPSFYTDVIGGLLAENKYLLSKYFYDETGDKLFQQIMACQEYYPTRCEMEILQHQSAKMVQFIYDNSRYDNSRYDNSRIDNSRNDNSRNEISGKEISGEENSRFNHGTSFDLVELGPGDATKSWFLLKELQKGKIPFTYYPIDISSNVISWLEDRLPVTLPGIRLHGLNGEYMDKMEQVNTFSANPKIVLFMGANIGNMTIQQAIIFCRQLHDRMQPGDFLFIGFDLKKHPKTILDAYNDHQGITRAFNLNLLHRINRELGADFEPEQFEHYPVYDPGTGTCKSYLISRVAQQVHIGEKTISFREHEPLHMEISQKYTLEETSHLAAQSGFLPVQTFLDSKKWFADVLWQRQP